eukprot:scaffold8015_cov149-Isochrysis_galbana.AAC.8
MWARPRLPLRAGDAAAFASVGRTHCCVDEFGRTVQKSSGRRDLPRAGTPGPRAKKRARQDACDCERLPTEHRFPPPPSARAHGSPVERHVRWNAGPFCDPCPLPCCALPHTQKR